MNLYELSREELIHHFFSLSNANDIAAFFNISYGSLTYRLYRMPNENKYVSFDIPKRDGVRQIYAPHPAIKVLQSKLNYVLQTIHKSKPAVHGFIRGRSILTNAKGHKRQKYVLSVDLKDFFPSINFGRVLGMFMSFPFNFNKSVAAPLAQLCCFDNELPQGAPTSPIISNILCSKLDTQLKALARFYGCYYTRYADDLTFSTSITPFPEALFHPNNSTLGPPLLEVIRGNGFEVNESKIRFRNKYSRQIVTGLIVNKIPNVKREFVRQIRAALPPENRSRY